MPGLKYERDKDGNKVALKNLDKAKTAPKKRRKKKKKKVEEDE